MIEFSVGEQGAEDAPDLRLVSKVEYRRTMAAPPGGGEGMKATGLIYWIDSHHGPKLLGDRLYEVLAGFGRVVFRSRGGALCGVLRY